MSKLPLGDATKVHVACRGDTTRHMASQHDCSWIDAPPWRVVRLQHVAARERHVRRRQCVERRRRRHDGSPVFAHATRYSPSVTHRQRLQLPPRVCLISCRGCRPQPPKNIRLELIYTDRPSGLPKRGEVSVRWLVQRSDRFSSHNLWRRHFII